jgi:hypothetical protein
MTTSTGSRTVNVAPWPRALWTVTSPSLLLLRHTDPMVDHRELDALPPADGPPRHMDCHGAVGGELRGIAQQVEENLTCLGQVGVHRRSQIVRSG